MFKSILSIFLLFCCSVFAQVNLDANNVNALVSNSGILFQDHQNASAAYEFPKESNTFVIYSHALWMGGKDINGQLHLAADMFDADFIPGPIAFDYNSTYYTSTFGNSVWGITRDQVNYHIANYGGFGYTPDPAIANWPGNGNVSEGVAAQLAPYVDVNNDQIYDPMDGDHPYFQGDEAVFLILNDIADTIHPSSGGAPLGVEVHLLLYHFAGTGIAADNSTFVNTKVFNRSSTDYYDFVFSLWTDFDIGMAQNDFIGSDSVQNMAYAYNGVTTDQGGPGQNAYGSNPPASGVKFLNHNAGGAIAGGGAVPEPTTASTIYNYMNNIFSNGSHLTYGGNGFGGTVPANFIYSSTPTDTSGWSMYTEAGPPGDRRIVLNGTPITFGAGTEICYDYALITDNSQNHFVNNVNGLLNAATEVQDFYDNNIQACNMIFLSAVEQKEVNVKVFPNPSNGYFRIQSSESFDYQVFDMNGRLVQSGLNMSPNALLNLEVENGIYILEILIDDQKQQTKLQVIK